MHTVFKERNLKPLDNIRINISSIKKTKTLSANMSKTTMGRKPPSSRSKAKQTTVTNLEET